MYVPHEMTLKISFQSDKEYNCIIPIYFAFFKKPLPTQDHICKALEILWIKFEKHFVFPVQFMNRESSNLFSYIFLLSVLSPPLSSAFYFIVIFCYHL